MQHYVVLELMYGLFFYDFDMAKPIQIVFVGLLNFSELQVVE